jgi:hypothetical protein
MRTPAQKRAAQREHEHRELAREIARKMIPWLRELRRNGHAPFVMRWGAIQARELARELVALARLVDKRAARNEW